MKTIDKGVVITGAASGIGKAIARRLYADGLYLTIADIDREALEKFANSLQGDKSRLHMSVTNVADEKSVREMVHSSAKKFGRLDFAVNNAGLVGPRGKNIAESDSKEFSSVMATDVDGTYFGLKYQIPEMLKVGGGSIVNMASGAGLVGVPGEPGYVAAKHAIIGLTKAAAIEYGKQNIRVNAIAPGFVETEAVLAIPEKDRQQMIGLHPMGRFGKPEEIAALVSFLLIGEAEFISGATIPIDGGYTAQ